MRHQRQHHSACTTAAFASPGAGDAGAAWGLHQPTTANLPSVILLRPVTLTGIPTLPATQTEDGKGVHEHSLLPGPGQNFDVR
ncbi:hypothetical protein U9M48_041025 [Paspalum notatum var. saurae]|uniref:Uncharacterized protein n=1 Tax=Paspalum notatum var. saurae TaxID=547442 RepID=A0AAQ3UMW8_PASNO